jgi:hypothetical protein
MTHTASGSPTPQPERRPVRNALAGATSIAAGALLLVSGIATILQGISSLVADNLLVITSDYIYKLNTTTWGWIHIVVGVLLAVIAVGLIAGATWARIAAIVMASLSIVAMFLWLPYYPVWSLVVIALDVIVIWAVTTWDSGR